MPDMKRNIKDSVFTYLFSQPEYAKQLYVALHPEDRDVSESDLKIVTLENVLSTGQYNDLGIQVRDKLILLVEAQSTFSVNIVLRMLMYLAETFKEYVEEHKLSLYAPKKVSIPCPELYMVYSGGQEEVPDVLRLSDLYKGEGNIEVEVKVLREHHSGNILDQYLGFCEISNEQVRLHGRTQQAINETIRLCIKQGILAPFLGYRKKEVLDIMVSLFDQEKIWEIEKYNIALDAEQKGIQRGRQEGLQEGLQKGMREERAALVKKLLKQFSVVDVSGMTGIPESEIARLANQ